MRLFSFLVLYLLILNNLSACSCSYSFNSTFNQTSSKSEFVALVKVLSFDEYLEFNDSESGKRIPYSMTVEVLKKFRGKEDRIQISILGDNGMLCRPYLTEFEINSHYLIAPTFIDYDSSKAYEFFSCRTDYLMYDIESNKLSGRYSWFRNKLDLETFENKLEKGDFDLIFILSFLIFILLLLSIRRILKS